MTIHANQNQKRRTVRRTRIVGGCAVDSIWSFLVINSRPSGRFFVAHFSFTPCQNCWPQWQQRSLYIRTLPSCRIPASRTILSSLSPHIGHTALTDCSVLIFSAPFAPSIFSCPGPCVPALPYYISAFRLSAHTWYKHAGSYIFFMIPLCHSRNTS